MAAGATVSFTLFAQGWQLEIITPGTQPTIRSDRGELNIARDLDRWGFPNKRKGGK